MSKIIYLFATLMSTAFAYNLTCPHLSHWVQRAVDVCSTVKSYVCLWDQIDEVYVEQCTGPWPQRPGHKSVLNIGNSCSPNNFQPFLFTTIGTKECVYQKSLCNGEGQVYEDTESPIQDVRCRCDYTRGYVFVKRNTDLCYCIPFKEDCSCYIKSCEEGNSLSPDYICTKDITLKQNYTCPMLSTKSDRVQQDNRTMMNEEEYTYLMVPIGWFILAVVISTTALIGVILFLWKNLEVLFYRCRKGNIHCKMDSKSQENEILQLERLIETTQNTSTGTNNNIEAPNTIHGSNIITNNCQNNIPNQQYSSCNTCHHHSCNDRQQSFHHQQEIMERLRSLENQMSLRTALNHHISLQSRIVNQQPSHIPYAQPPQGHGYYAYPIHMAYNTHHPNNFYGGQMYQQGVPQFGYSTYNNPYHFYQGGMSHFGTLPNHNISIY